MNETEDEPLTAEQYAQTRLWMDTLEGFDEYICSEHCVDRTLWEQALRALFSGVELVDKGDESEEYLKFLHMDDVARRREWRAVMRHLRVQMVYEEALIAAQPDNNRFWKVPSFGPSSVIKLPPGHYIDKAARFLYSRQSYDRIFAQSILDMREEYYDAIQSGDETKARWIHVRGVGCLIWTAVFYAWDSMFGRLVRALFKIS